MRRGEKLLIEIIQQGLLALLFLAITPFDALSQVQVSSGYTIETFATVVQPTSLAFAPEGSPFGPDLYVGTFAPGGADPLNPNAQRNSDQIFTVSGSGVVTVFTTLPGFITLPGEPDPVALEFPPVGSPFPEALYISSNNRDGGKIQAFGGIGDCGGAIQVADRFGTVTDFTSLTSTLPCGTPPVDVQTALPEPMGLAFGPGGAFGTDIYIANSSDLPADIMRVDTTGAASIFLSDGKSSPLGTFGFAPYDVEFGPGGDFGSNLYFTDAGERCNCIRIADAAGVFGAPFVTLPGTPLAIEFGRGGGFGYDLYVALLIPGNSSVFRVKADGTLSLVATGFVGFQVADQLEFSPDGSALYVADFSGNTIYKITSPPITDVSVIDTISTVGIDLNGSSFSRAPFSITAGTDQTRIEWRFPTFNIGQVENLSFNVLLKNPVAGEERLVNHRLEVLYTDFNGNPVRTELGPQYVHVLTSAFQTTVSTDKAEYSANESALIDLAITNLSGLTRTVDARLEIEESQGAFVQTVTTLPGLIFAPGETKTFLDWIYNTGTTFAGDYRMHARLIEAGNQVGEATTAFTILPVRQAASKIVSDKISYSSNEPVNLTSTITSQSPNHILANLEATITVTDPSSMTIFTETRSVSDLLPETRFEFKSLTVSGTHPAALYTATLQVRSGGTPLTSATTHFEIASSLAQAEALSGTIEVNPGAIFEKESTTFQYTVQNTGNTLDLPLILLEILVVDPDTEQPVRTLTAEASLNSREVFINSVLFDSTGLLPKPYLVVLRGTTAGVTQTLNSAGLMINPIPNHAPTADAGADRLGLIGQPVALDGTESSDPDQDPLTYKWHFVSAPATSQLTDVSFANGTTPNPSFVPDAQGIYVISLMVNDGLADSQTDTVSVFVNPVPYFDLHPETINLKSNGGSKSVTGVLTSPVLSAFAFFTAPDGTTVTAHFTLENRYVDQNGNVITFTLPADEYPGDDTVNPVDTDGDGHVDLYQLTLKFNRDRIIAGFKDANGNLKINQPTDLISTIIGNDLVIGSDTNEVISPPQVSRGGS
jgi:hypothetical protein